jgi:hypothetical protein
MRRSSILLLIGLCLVLAACDGGAPVAVSTPTPTSPPTTTFDELGIEAELPGTNWRDIPYNIDDAEAYGKMRGDNQLLFFAVRTSQQVNTDAELKVLTDGFARGAMVPPYTVERAEFQGYPSYVLEGVLKMPTVSEDYRTRINFFTAHDKVHIVGAGATIGEWTATGEDLVTQILSGVRVR